jgi:hypothetical protein
MKHQRKPAGGPADPHVKTPAIRQPDMIKSIHATILASRHNHRAQRALDDRDRHAMIGWRWQCQSLAPDTRRRA